MKFTEQKLRHFFSLFTKELTNSEVDLLLTGEGTWSATEATKTQIKKIEKYSWIFSLIPGIEAVFFCNTTAFRSAKDSSDIDLFIVTKDSQLWISRFSITLITQILGVRRHGNKIAHRFCLSFFATKSGAFELEKLQIEKNNDPYFAAWAATLECIIAKPNFLTEFYAANSWLNNYNLKFTQSWSPKKINCFQTWLGNILEHLGLEWILKKILLPRTIKKAEQLPDKTGTIISEKYLKFHNKDKRKEIANTL